MGPAPGPPSPRAPWRSPPVRAGKDQSAGRVPSCVFKCCKLTAEQSPRPRCARWRSADRSHRDHFRYRRQGEWDGSRKQLPRIALCERRRARFAMLSGWHPVGNWVASAGIFSQHPFGTTEITFDIGDKAIECLGRAGAAVELAARKQLRLGCRASTSRALRCKPSLDATRTMALTACAFGKDQSAGRAPAACSNAAR